MLFHVLLLSLFTNRDPCKEAYIGVLRIRFIGIYVDIWVFSTLNHQWSGKGQDQESSLRNRWAMSGLQVLSVLEINLPFNLQPSLRLSSMCKFGCLFCEPLSQSNLYNTSAYLFLPVLR